MKLCDQQLFSTEDGQPSNFLKGREFRPITQWCGQTPLTLHRLGAYGKSVPLCPQDLGFSQERRPAAKRRQAVAQLIIGRVHRLLVLRAQLHLPSPTPSPNPHLAAWTSVPRMLTAQVCRFGTGIFFSP